MNQRFFRSVWCLFLATGAFFCSFSVLNFTPTAWGDEAFQVSSADLTLKFRVVKTDGADGPSQCVQIDSLTDTETGTEFLLPQRSYLFVLQYQDTATKELRYLNSQSPWNSITVTQADSTTTVRFQSPTGVPNGETLWMEVRITANPNGGRGLDFAMAGAPETKAYSYRRGCLTQLFLRKFGERMNFLYPRNCGCVQADPMNEFFWASPYPGGIICTMGLMSFWDTEKNLGLYTSSHDPTGATKDFLFDSRKETTQTADCGKLHVDYLFENMGQPGNGVTAPGTFHVEAYHGDWYDAARMYRAWAHKNARWMPEMGPNGRVDVPQWLKEHCAWVMASSDECWLTITRFTYTPLDKMGDALRAYQESVGVPIAVHWYLWHEGPYDNDFPHFFPAKKGFREVVFDIQKDGKIRVMPYTNGHLWDTRDRGIEDWQYTSHGKPLAVKNEDGSVWTEQHTGLESDGSRSVLAGMCPVTQGWKDQVRENTLTAMNQHNTAAVYIDQVAACVSCPCFDPTHGHPLGGGSWWIDGYRDMMKRIRTDMRQEVPDIPLTPELKERLKTQPNLLSERIVSTECNAEPYVNLFDAMLVWHWNDPGQVPAFPVIYGDCIPMFGRAYRGDDFSFVSRVGQQLAFGEQIGWFDPSTCQKPDFPYIRDAIRFRWQIRDFFYLGEMNRPPRWNQMPQVTSVWPFSRDQEITLDAVQAAVWRKLDWNAAQQGKTETTAVVVYFSNITEDTVHAAPVLNWEELGLAGKSVRISRVDAEGKTLTELTLEDLTKPMDFPARKSWGFLIEVVK